MADFNDEDLIRPFPLEKILTVSLTEWISTQALVIRGRREGELSSDRYIQAGDYTCVGVHYEGPIDPVVGNTLKRMFAGQVPKDVEVVVGYQPETLVCNDCLGKIYGSASGTALIPRK